MSFSVVTWNVLAQAYLKPGRYDHVPPHALLPEPRRGLLIRQILALDADVYCLQEVEPDAFAAIRDALGAGYAGEFEQKRAKPDGSAVFWRTDALARDRVDRVHYRAVDAGYDQVAVLVVLRDRAADRRVGIVSTHLPWQADSVPIERHLGRLQMLELLDRRDQLGDPPDAWIVAGDLNTVSTGAPIRAAEDRGLRESCRDQRPWDTVNIGGKRRKLDYLLFEGPLTPRPDPLPTLERDTPMPSDQHPSDHLPLRVVYTWS